VTAPDTLPALVSLVVPTYDERENILPLLGEVRAAMAGRALEIWVVDDDSPDGTWRVAAEYAEAHPEVAVLRRTGGRGLSAAILDGFARCRGGILAVMDEIVCRAGPLRIVELPYVFRGTGARASAS
jgi:dolichol-phosphate mannosyltransferase